MKAMFYLKLSHEHSLPLMATIQPMTAAASLVSDCSTIEGRNDILKITYAAQLAVCELEATGIKYPRECQSSGGSPLREARVMECVRRLEERPQWWTTLSNNIQSAVVMCSAVRHEVEKDEILILHKNITKTQKSLFSALSTSLEEAWESVTAQKSFKGVWKTTLNGVLEDLAETKGKVVDALRDAEANATSIINNLTQELEMRRKEQRQTVHELDQFVLGAINKFQELGEHSEKVAGVVETAMIDLSTDINTKRGAIEQSLYSIHRISSQFYVDFNSSIDNMLRTVDSLSIRIIDSSVKLETLANTFKSHSSFFDSISSSYTELTKNHVTLTKSLVKQEETQQQLFSSLEKSHDRVNITFVNLLKMMDNLSQSLEQTSTAIHSWRVNGPDWAGIPISSIMFISGILFAKGWEKVILISLGALVIIALVILIGFVQFNGTGFLGMFGHGVFRKLPSAVEPFIDENLDNTGRVKIKDMDVARAHINNPDCDL
ncbi:Tht1-like nuclear fusion protein-domain-containing protein [Morchella snyderi]|nr:Tht1-like nuclear fusion protein-domain-containing protein [Morchella snyderi]